jgi:tetratricopeptide (TPR) repeat protein
LAGYGYAAEDPDRQKVLIADAASYLKRSVECMEGDVLEKVATLRLLAPKYGWIDQEPEAIKYYEQAYNMIPDIDAEELSPEERKKIRTIRVEILTSKAQVLSEMDRREDALQAFNEARGLLGEDTLAGSILDNITLLFQKEDEADASKLMEVLKSWTEKERNSWFSYCFEDWVDQDAATRMQRASKLTKETDLLLGWLTALGTTLPAQSLHLFNLRGVIAYMHYPVLGDLVKGKTLRQEILAMKPKPFLWYEDTMNETKTQHRMQLADILFCEFQMSADPTKKEAIMEELRLLPSAHDDDDNMRESHVSMLRANMLRIMGPAKEYQKYMDELFANCICGLEDGVSWNDSSSLRLLSKVLASLPTLEKDARISISSQFSILDRSIHGQAADSEHSETLSEKDGGEADAEQVSTGEDQASTGSDESISISSAGRAQEVGEDNLSNGAIGKDQGTAESAEATVAKLDEDIGAWIVNCDGGCGTTIESWAQPFYYCVICPNTDLCEDCHSKRLKQTIGEIEEPWLSFCGANHRYIKGPMKNWKGIKNGVIRFSDEEVTVKEWLHGLKEDRWPNAWKVFWTRQGGLKDIGIED